MLEGIVEEMARADRMAKEAQSLKQLSMLDMVSNTVPLRSTFQSALDRLILRKPVPRDTQRVHD